MTTPIDVLVADYHAGLSIRALARKYGTSFQNINIRLLNAGVQMRPPGNWRATVPFIEKTCPTCGRLFHTKQQRQRFCSQLCVRKKTVCIRGHVLTEDNRYHFPSSASRCIQCAKMRQRGEI